MKKLVIEMKVIADGMVHHVAKAFFDLQVFLSAFMAVMAFQYGSAVKAVVLFAVMFLHRPVLLKFNRNMDVLAMMYSMF